MDGVIREVAQEEIDWAEKNGYVFCTSLKPQREGRIIHPDAKSVGDVDYGDAYYERLECPYCGLRFKTEVAQ